MCIQDRSVRLFDCGALNTYKDELRFVLCVASCCRSASLEASLHVDDIAMLQSRYLSIMSDVAQLVAAVTSQTVDAVLRPSTQWTSRQDLVDLARRYVAARWLRRVLICNNVPVDDMQAVECGLLDAATRWAWLRDFISVL